MSQRFFKISLLSLALVFFLNASKAMRNEFDEVMERNQIPLTPGRSSEETVNAKLALLRHKIAKHEDHDNQQAKTFLDEAISLDDPVAISLRFWELKTNNPYALPGFLDPLVMKKLPIACKLKRRALREKVGYEQDKKEEERLNELLIGCEDNRFSMDAMRYKLGGRQSSNMIGYCEDKVEYERLSNQLADMGDPDALWARVERRVVIKNDAANLVLLKKDLELLSPSARSHLDSYRLLYDLDAATEQAIIDCQPNLQEGYEKARKKLKASTQGDNKMSSEQKPDESFLNFVRNQQFSQASHLLELAKDSLSFEALTYFYWIPVSQSQSSEAQQRLCRVMEKLMLDFMPSHEELENVFEATASYTKGHTKSYRFALFAKFIPRELKEAD